MQQVNLGYFSIINLRFFQICMNNYHFMTNQYFKLKTRIEKSLLHRFLEPKNAAFYLTNVFMTINYF